LKKHFILNFIKITSEPLLRNEGLQYCTSKLRLIQNYHLSLHVTTTIPSSFKVLKTLNKETA